ncbi:MAG: iron-containing alcohol dehydrogenase, partial [Verrucomicrobiales bacterium]
MHESAFTIDALCARFDVAEEIRHFAHIPGGKVIFGTGSARMVGQEALELGAKRVLLVTDPGIRAAGHEDLVMESLSGAGLEIVVFDEVKENPTTEDVDRCLAAIEGREIDVIVGLGGGSSMDTAKGTNFIRTNGGRMQDYWG